MSRRGRRIPALPTLAPSLLVPDFSAPRSAAFPLDRIRPRGRPDGFDGRDAPDGKTATLYYLARNGVFHGLRALGVGGGDVVLMPAWHHGVEVEAVRRAGADVVFYRVDRGLRADLDDARDRARRTGARVLYLTYFIGFPQPLEEARALCREQGLLLVEDCALALYSRDAAGRPFGSDSDLAVFCLYKTLPVPHGGVAVSRVRLPEPTAPPLLSTLHHMAGSLRAHARLRRGPSPLLDAARGLARRTIDRVVAHEHTGTQHLDPAQLGLGASALLPSLLARVDAEMVVVRRRRNYRLLLEALGDERLAPCRLPEGACPLFFPLLVGDKQRAMTELDALGIETIDFWSVGDPALDAAAFPDAGWLRRHVLEVPIHQDLDDEAIAQVGRAVAQVLPRAGRARWR